MNKKITKKFRGENIMGIQITKIDYIHFTSCRKNLLSEVSFFIRKHAFTPIPEINESVVKEIDEIIEDFINKKKEG